jgi:hypothetical protein
MNAEGWMIAVHLKRLRLNKHSKITLLLHRSDVLLSDLLRQTLNDPGLHQGLRSSQPALWVPHQQLLYKLDKLHIRALAQNNLD